MYLAAKILSRDATLDSLGGNRTILELDALQKVRDAGGFDSLPRLRDNFMISQDAHLCMIMDLLGSDVGTFRRTAPQKALPHYTVRIIMRQVVDALATLHKIGIVHTGAS